MSDLTGRQFGRLIVIASGELTKNAKRMWICVCACGTKKAVRVDHLNSGRVVSCGCNRLEKLSERSRTHGKSNTRVYRIWRDMLNRCHYEKYPERHLYGGRGIQVCERWRTSFENFYADMGVPEAHHSIDRIDNERGYEPDNCRWATATEQARNRRPPKRQAA